MDSIRISSVQQQCRCIGLIIQKKPNCSLFTYTRTHTHRFLIKFYVKVYTNCVCVCDTIHISYYVNNWFFFIKKKTNEFFD